jgi:tRNA pseudouridine38-40 synthase
MRNICLVIEYEGTNYYGWQIQKRYKTIQGELLKAIKKVTGEDVILYGSGRTDRGVHAIGQVANFNTISRIPVSRFPYALNAHLPRDITVKEAREVPLEFNAQFCAKSKVYRYTILNSTTPRALFRNFAYLVRSKLSIKNIRNGARYLIGKKDFRSFAKDAKEKINTTRAVKRISIKKDSEVITIEIQGDGFLYAMVRGIVGTLLQVGLGKIKPKDVKKILDSKNRRLAGPNVPAKGLCLISVQYEKIKGYPHHN